MAIGLNSDLTSTRFLQQTDRRLSNNLGRLSSGKRLVRASDDAAGLAIAQKLRAQLGSLEQASRNVDHGVSLGQVADSAMGDQGDMLIRMRELAVQSANGTLGDAERASIQQEFNELRAEVDRVASSTDFNGQSVLTGQSFDMQAGTGAGAADVVTVNTPDTRAATLGLAPLNVATQGGAQAALGGLDDAIAQVASGRGEVGAAVNRLHSARSNLAAAVQNTASSLSRIADADVASEASSLAANSVLMRSGIAMQRQANTTKGLLVNLIT